MANVGRMLKESMVEELAKQLSERPNVFVTGVSRLTASDANALRAKLHGARARLVMVKRRIGQRTLERLSLSGISGLLEGSVAFVLTAEDGLPIAKELVEFTKAHENQLAVRGAWIDGQLLDGGRVKALAELPPRPTLLAQVVGTVELPLAHLIGTIEQLIGEVAWALEQIATKAGTAPKAGSPTEVPGTAGRRPTKAGEAPPGFPGARSAGARPDLTAERRPPLPKTESPRPGAHGARHSATASMAAAPEVPGGAAGGPTDALTPAMPQPAPGLTESEQMHERIAAAAEQSGVTLPGGLNQFRVLNLAQETKAMAAIRQIATACAIAISEEGPDATITFAWLKERYMLPAAFAERTGYYAYSIKPSGDWGVQIHATPVNPSKNLRHLLVDQDGIMHAEHGRPATIHSPQP